MRECFERNGSAQNGSKRSCKREAYPCLRGTVPYRTVPILYKCFRHKTRTDILYCLGVAEGTKFGYFVLGCDAQCLSMGSIYFVVLGSLTEHPHERAVATLR